MNALRVAERLDKDEFPLTVACFRDDGALRDRFVAAGARVVEFPVRSLYGRSALREGLAFKRFLQLEHIDIVHSHDRYANVFAVPWARLAGVPGIIASKRWNSMSRVHAVGNRAAFQLAHRVLGNSGRVGDSLVAEDFVPRRKVVVVTNFVEEGAFQVPSPEWRAAARASLDISDGATVVGIVANLRAIKDHSTLLRAVARLAPSMPELMLVMMGDGPDRAKLEALAKELGIESRVRFAGTYPNHPNPHSLFDVSTLTSVSEGFPNSIVEAMAARRPVVATDSGGVSDAVLEGETGFLVPVGDDAALARAFERLLGDESLRAQMGARAEAVARERFTPANTVGKLQQLYRDLVSASSS